MNRLIGKMVICHQEGLKTSKKKALLVGSGAFLVSLLIPGGILIDGLIIAAAAEATILQEGAKRQNRF